MERIFHESLDFLFLGESYWYIHKYKDSPSQYLGTEHRLLYHNDWREWVKVGENEGWLNGCEQINEPTELILRLAGMKLQGKYPRTAPRDEDFVKLVHEAEDGLWDKLSPRARFFTEMYLRIMTLVKVRASKSHIFEKIDLSSDEEARYLKNFYNPMKKMTLEERLQKHNIPEPQRRELEDVIGSKKPDEFLEFCANPAMYMNLAMTDFINRLREIGNVEDYMMDVAEVMEMYTQQKVEEEFVEKLDPNDDISFLYYCTYKCIYKFVQSSPSLSSFFEDWFLNLIFIFYWGLSFRIIMLGDEGVVRDVKERIRELRERRRFLELHPEVVEEQGISREEIEVLKRVFHRSEDRFLEGITSLKGEPYQPQLFWD